MYVIVALICLSVAIPTLFYIYHFYSFPISDNISAWGSFGSYFGGILSPVSSLCSTFLLVYITIMLNKQNSQENHKAKILDVKREHYYRIVENLHSFSDWLCAKRRYDLEVKEARIKYDNLSHKEKDTIEYKVYLMNLDLYHKFIYDDYIKLLSLNYFILGLSDKYGAMYSSIRSQEFENLKNQFNSFTMDVEKSIIEKGKFKNDEQNMKILIDKFISAMQSEINLKYAI